MSTAVQEVPYFLQEERQFSTSVCIVCSSDQRIRRSTKLIWAYRVALLCLRVGSCALGNPSVPHSMNYTVIGGVRSEIDQALESRGCIPAWPHRLTEDVNGIGLHTPLLLGQWEARCIRARIPLRKYAQTDIVNASLDASYSTGHQWRVIFIIRRTG